MALPEFTAIAELEFPELHDESIPTLTFAKAVQRLLAASGVRDFMLKVLDLTAAGRIKLYTSRPVSTHSLRAMTGSMQPS